MIYFAQCQTTELIRIGLSNDWEKTKVQLNRDSPTRVELMKIVRRIRDFTAARF